MATKIKETREILHLTLQYVANYLGIPLFDYISIEEGISPLSDLQIQKLQNLYGITTEHFFSKREITEEDRAETSNVIKFKRRNKL